MKILLILSLFSASIISSYSTHAQSNNELVASSAVDLFSETRKFLNDVNQLSEANFNDGMYKKFLSRINADIKNTQELLQNTTADNSALYSNTIKKMNEYKTIVEKEINNKSKKTKATLIKSINTYLSL